MNKKLMLWAITVIALVIIFSSNCMAAVPEDDTGVNKEEISKAGVMSEAIKQAEKESSRDDYKQRLGKVIVKEETPAEESPNEIDTLYRFMPKRAAKQLSGTVGITESEIEYSHNFKVFGKLPVQFGLGAGYTSINNTTEVYLPAHLTDIAFDIETTFNFFNVKNTYLRVGITPTFKSDNWRVNNSNCRILPRVFAIYQPNDKLTLIGGIAAFPGYENKFAPIVGIIYKYSDKLLFNLTPKRPTINYALTDKLNVFLEGDFSGGEYQVKKDGYKKAILQYNEIHTGAGVQYSVNDFIDVSLSTGYMFNRYLKYRDSLGKVDIKSGLYMDCRIEALF